MQALISNKTATSKCQYRRRQPVVDRNRCVAGTTSICGVPSTATAAAADAHATSPQSPDEPSTFARSGKARMRQQHDWCLRPINTTSLPVAAAASSQRRPLRGGSRRLNPAPETFFARLPEMPCNRFSAPIVQFNWFAFAAGAAISVLAKLSFQTLTCPRRQPCEISKP
jgi:hypothetical protein